MPSSLQCHLRPECHAVVIVVPSSTLGSLSLLGDDRVGHEVARLSLSSGSKHVILDLTEQPLIGARFVGILAGLTRTLAQTDRRLIVAGDPLGVLLVLGMRDYLSYASSLEEAVQRCQTSVLSSERAKTEAPDSFTQKPKRSPFKTLMIG
ncbi:MAG: hypothetical protein ACKV2Q_32910 [Planctomycetaceae bacterium]